MLATTHSRLRRPSPARMTRATVIAAASVRGQAGPAMARVMAVSRDRPANPDRGRHHRGWDNHAAGHGPRTRHGRVRPRLPGRQQIDAVDKDRPVTCPSAERMFIAAGTIKVDLAHDYAKLELPTRAALATARVEHHAGTEHP